MRFTYKEFRLWLRDLTKGSCNDVYYYSSKETLAEGIIRIDSDADYWEFVEAAYTPEAELDVYIDHQKQLILDWADNEVLSDGNMYDLDGNEEEDDKEEEDDNDEDDNLDDIMAYEHEVDEEVHTFNKTIGDDFLNKLLGIGNLSDDDEPNDGIDDKLCVTNYAVKNGYDLWYGKSDHNRLLVKCCKGKKNKKNKGCPFRLRATWMTNERSFQIKSLIDNHNCSRVFKFGSIVSYKWIGNHFMNEILQKPKMSVRKLKAKVRKRFNLIASVGQCRNARRYAFKEIEGTLKEQYAKTCSYGEELRRSNPVSTVKMDVDVMPDGTTYFSKFYVCLKGVKDGWIQGCRRLLAAVGRDANNHIYPLAWDVVAVESKETWKWFVDLLLDDIEMGSGNGLTLISGQHRADKERVPAAEHKQCASHICANFLKKFKGKQFIKLFWYVAASTTQAKFEQYMNEIKKLEPLTYDHLMERDPKTWSKSFFETNRACNAYENGVPESFNSVIDDARKRPLITMLEEIRIYVMERLCTQKSKGSSWGDLHICPSIRLKLSKIKALQRFWRVVPSGYQEFEVRLGYDAYSVDLGKKTCACKAWQSTGYPYMHAYAVISNLK
uniref:SWIM-type domain-containing protein n=1 Tax=Lactuca sativa TaxID=4236 RepID=A0A9R1WBZ2_LACSA|nr:hypothetical protein LSAT_V11C200051040 [Lactuca sativa]